MGNTAIACQPCCDGGGMMKKKKSKLALLEWNGRAVSKSFDSLLWRARSDDPRLTKIHLFNQFLGDGGAGDLAAALRGNCHVRLLGLWQNHIGHGGARDLAEVLGSDGGDAPSALKAFSLGGNRVGPDGARALAEALPRSSLDELWLWKCGIGAEGAVALADALAGSPSLTKLFLGSNGIDGEGARALGRALETNRTLTVLDLCGNEIGTEGARFLQRALERNCTLTTLNLSENRIAPEVMQEISRLVEINSSSLVPQAAEKIKASGSEGSVSQGSNKERSSEGARAPLIETGNTGCSSPPYSIAEYESRRNIAAEFKDADPICRGREIMQDALRSPASEPRVVPIGYIKKCTKHFADETKIGEGSHAEVYEGKDRALRQKFAVKRLRVKLWDGLNIDKARRTFEREIMTLTHFHHPNIARLYGYFLSPDPSRDQCLVYELASNGSLHDWLKHADRKERLHWTTRIDIALGLAKALEHLHGGGAGGGSHTCFHCDVKSSNVCLRKDFSPLLIDFGISRMAPRQDSAVTETIMESGALGCVRGTPGYICPAYARRAHGYTGASEVFSMGVVLIELLTGVLQNSSVGDGDGDGKTTVVDLVDLFGEGGDRDLRTAADPRAGTWNADVRDGFADVALRCVSLRSGDRPLIGSTVRSLRNLSGRSRPWSPGERNRVAVLSSAPLAYATSDGTLHPIRAALDFALEREVLEDCVGGRDVELKFGVATVDNLRAVAAERCGCLHLSGHGHEEALLFEDGTGGAHWVGRDKLCGSLHHEPFKFVFVSACHSRYMGQAFVDAQIPHVVCCDHSDAIKDDAAIKFTRGFYSTLSEGYTIQAAFDAGKMAVSNWFGEKEADKFLLLPKHRDHDVCLFDADKCEEKRPEEKSFIPVLPPCPEGNELKVYKIIQLILSNQLVTLVHNQSDRCTQLASSISHYIQQRIESIPNVSVIHYVQLGLNVSPLKQLENQLKPVRENRANIFQTEGSSLMHSIINAIQDTKALVVIDGLFPDDTRLTCFITLMLKVGKVKFLMTAPVSTGISVNGVKECVVKI